MKTRSLLLALVLAAAPAFAAAKPNILLIVGDDMGYGDIGAHGCKDIPTPHLDSLAKNGVRCTNGYVSGPYCSPTRAGLLTGRYQQRFGHEFNPGPPGDANVALGLSLKETTLAQRMKTAGYATGWVGKWHLGHAPEFHPMKRGFDEAFGFPGGAHPYLATGARGQRGNPIQRGTETIDEKEYLTDAFAREAGAFIGRHKDEPWFLYLAFNAVHAPLQATDKYLARFSGIADPRRRTYAAMMSAMDDAIGSVLAKVRETGADERTLIMFISDNGGPENANGSDNGPLRGQKAQTWEGGVRVPFLVQWRGTLPAGKTYDQPVIQLDFAPTALAAAGVETPADAKFDGVNLLPFLKGENTAAPHSALYWRFGAQVAIRMGDWKLVKAAGAPGAGGRRGESSIDGAELYNLAGDIGEAKNLAAEQPDKTKELAAAWQKWNAELIAPTWGGGAGGAKRQAKKQKQ